MQDLQLRVSSLFYCRFARSAVLGALFQVLRGYLPVVEELPRGHLFHVEFYSFGPILSSILFRLFVLSFLVFALLLSI